MNLFGFEIVKSKEEKREEEKLVSFTPEYHDDGAAVITAGGASSMSIDLASTSKSESDLITKYRAMSMNSELEPAIDEIVNEAIVVDDENPTVEIILDQLDTIDIPETIKEIITEEFKNILDLLEFDSYGYDIFRRWYIDGRLNYHIMIDKTRVEDGIKELRYVDPRNIKKVREIKRTVDERTKLVNITTVAEYYVFNDTGFGNKSKGPIMTSQQNSQYGVKIAKDAICQINSGLMDENNNLVLSYLNKAVKPLNLLNSLEDSSIIYRLARGPERRVWYIDVGNLPKVKAEQYMKEIMTKHKNKVTYDSSSGSIIDSRAFPSVLEDIWIPRFAGGRGTQVDTLAGMTDSGATEEMNYFTKKLYKALNVPASRIDSENSMYTLGRATEISRDEIKFSKFIRRLRYKFAMLFTKLLEKQLILKNIVTHEEWELFKNKIKYKFNKDNYFEELKTTEILNERLTTLEKIMPFVGRYYSNAYVRKFILCQDEDEIDQIDTDIQLEQDIPQYNQPVHPFGMEPQVLDPNQDPNVIPSLSNDISSPDINNGVPTDKQSAKIQSSQEATS